jgi:hypothetical protein
MIRILGLTVPPLPPNLTGPELVLALNQRLRQLSLATGEAGGLTVVKTVKGADGDDYTLTFTDGILTGTTLP